MRDILQLACEACKRRNYSTTKNKRTMTDKLELKKYNPKLRRHTIYKERKK